jgi:hypothetical protein
VACVRDLIDCRPDLLGPQGRCLNYLTTVRARSAARRSSRLTRWFTSPGIMDLSCSKYSGSRRRRRRREGKKRNSIRSSKDRPLEGREGTLHCPACCAATPLRSSGPSCRAQPEGPRRRPSGSVRSRNCSSCWSVHGGAARSPSESHRRTTGWLTLQAAAAWRTENTEPFSICVRRLTGERLAGLHRYRDPWPVHYPVDIQEITINATRADNRDRFPILS